MNCKEFEDIVNDLAHGRIMDAVARDCGLAHAQVCANCAGRLSDDRALSALLRMLAASDEEKSAPFATESVLVAAFRQNAATGTAGSRQKMYSRLSNLLSALQAARSGNPQQVGQPAVHRSPIFAQTRPRRALAAAAMISFALGAFGLTARLTLQHPPTNQESVVNERSPLPAPAPGNAGGELTGEREKNAAGQEPRTAVVRSQEKRRPKASHHASARHRTQQVLIRDEMTLYAGDADVVTDFIPLTDDDSLKQIERGELIRVRMPRTALLKFGLPMNVERAGIPVKADLLVGEDGLAHAIRFVR
jgi:hypothetical protein